MNDTSKRQPAGIPAGGQFASHDRTDGDAELSGGATPIAVSLPSLPGRVFHGVSAGTWNGFPAPAFDFDTSTTIAALVNAAEVVQAAAAQDKPRVIEIRPDGFYEDGELLAHPTESGLYSFAGFMWEQAEVTDEAHPGECPRCGSWDDDLAARDGICETCHLEDQ